MENQIAARLEGIEKRIAEACRRAGRSMDEITLVGVSKHQPTEAIVEGYAAGLRNFGENYVQECVEKRNILKDIDPRWHFIGSLQRNKVRALLDAGDVLVHSVDSIPLAEKLSAVCVEKQKVLHCLIELRIGDEEGMKTGVLESDFPALLKAADSLPGLAVDGLMLIPPLGNGAEASRPYFKKLRTIFDQCNENRNEKFKHLSMGMSDDFEVAIEEGATIIRVGTAIFGPRKY